MQSNKLNLLQRALFNIKANGIRFVSLYIIGFFGIYIASTSFVDFDEVSGIWWSLAIFGIYATGLIFGYLKREEDSKAGDIARWVLLIGSGVGVISAIFIALDLISRI